MDKVKIRIFCNNALSTVKYKKQQLGSCQPTRASLYNTNKPVLVLIQSNHNISYIISLIPLFLLKNLENYMGEYTALKEETSWGRDWLVEKVLFFINLRCCSFCVYCRLQKGMASFKIYGNFLKSRMNRLKDEQKYPVKAKINTMLLHPSFFKLGRRWIPCLQFCQILCQGLAPSLIFLK